MVGELESWRVGELESFYLRRKMHLVCVPELNRKWSGRPSCRAFVKLDSEVNLLLSLGSVEFSSTGSPVAAGSLSSPTPSVSGPECTGIIAIARRLRFQMELEQNWQSSVLLPFR